MFRWRIVEEFVLEAQFLSWAPSILEPFPVPGVCLNFFVLERIWYNHTGIDLAQVKGTVHPDYVGMSWGEFLLKGRRMDHNLSMLQSNPAYYLWAGIKVPVMSYLLYGDRYWVYTDGHHRTCIGRFFLELSGMECVLEGVETWEVRLDLEAFEKWWNFGGFRGPLRVESSLEKRDDAPGWMAERFKLRYFIQEKEVDRSEFLGFDETRDSSWWGCVRGFFQRAKRGADLIWRNSER